MQRALAILVVVVGVGSAGSAVAASAAAPRLTVYVVDDVPPAIADAVEAGLERALAADARVQLRRRSAVVAAAEAAPRQLAEADRRASDADRAFGQMELAESATALSDALRLYGANILPLAARAGGTRPLLQAWIRLSRVRFFDGEADGAREALRHALVLDPGLRYTPRLFPPQMKRTVVEARLLYETLGPGKLTIRSTPPGATAYVNGVLQPEPTPTETEAPPGPSYVTLTRRGFAPATVVADVAGGGETSQTAVALERVPGDPAADLDAVGLRAGTPGAQAPLARAAAALGVDLIVLARVSSDPGQPRRIEARLYDARISRVLKRAQRTAAGEAPLEELAAGLAGELLDGARLDGWVAPPAPPSLGARLSARIDRLPRWRYFWLVVGGAAGAATAATALGVVGYETRRHAVAEGAVALGGR